MDGDISRWAQALTPPGMKRIPGKDPELAARLRAVAEELEALAEEYDDHVEFPRFTDKISPTFVERHTVIWGEAALPAHEEGHELGVGGGGEHRGGG